MKTSLNKRKSDIKYRRTKRGFLNQTYQNMKKRVEGKNLRSSKYYIGLKLMDKEEFLYYSESSIKFHNLWLFWRNKKFTRKYSPSVDRIDKNKGYTMDNIRWITLGFNSSRKRK